MDPSSGSLPASPPAERPFKAAIGQAVDLCREVGDAVTRRSRPLPAFVIAGGMRCGTTSLHACLAAHPQLTASRRKEVHYFDLQFDRGPGWYAQQFPAVRRLPDGSATRPFETSPYYMFDPRVPARLRDTMPDVRVVFLLRDPVERAFSHYIKNLRDGREPLAFAAAIDAEEQRLAGEEERMLADPRYMSPVHRYYSYRSRGLYAALIARFLRHFPAERLFAIDTHRLFADPGGVTEELCGFLGLDPWRPARLTRLNATHSGATLDTATRRRLEDWFEPHERALESLIGWRPSGRGRTARAA